MAGRPRFRRPNYRHQDREFEEGRDLEARALLWQMRTGKSKATIDKACHNFEAGRIDAVLVLAPNGVHANWLRQQFRDHAWEGVPVVGHCWRSSAADRAWHRDGLARVTAASELELPVLAVNVEALDSDRTQGAIKALLRRRRTFLVVDESHVFGSPSATRTRLVRGLARRCAMRQILTGTSVHNSPLQAYSQFEILHEGALGFSRYSSDSKKGLLGFKDRYAVWGNNTRGDGRSYPVVMGYQNLDELRDRMARWSSVVLREDCEDLPELMLVEREVGLSDEQRRLYAQVRDELLAELADRWAFLDDALEIPDGGSRLTKLQQILSGFVNDEQGRPIRVDGPVPRIDATLDEVGGSDGKVIVWCRFREEIRMLAEGLRRRRVPFVEYHGGVGQRQRQAAEDAFREDPSVRCFLGQALAGGVGLDLSAASTIVNHSHIPGHLIARDQAIERATKVGGRRVVVVDVVAPLTVDEAILADLKSKRETSDELAGRGLRDRLLEMLKETGI